MSERVRLTHPARQAAGLPAVLKSLEKSWDEMGAVRTLQTLRIVNQVGGFDCPSCAWPDPADPRSRFEFCENGAKAVADEATLRRVTPEFFAQWSLPALEQQTDHWLNAQGRLTHPMVRRAGSGHYEPIEWDGAFALIAEELRRLPTPDAAAFYTSGRTSNEAAFLYQTFARKYGTNNLPDCSNMCHESSGEAMRETLGVGKGMVQLEDFALADAIFVIGQNPGTNHPRMLSSLQAAARRGCRIVSINPLPEAGLIAFAHPQEVMGLLGHGTPLSTLWLPVRLNGDVALLKGMMKEMLAEEDRRPGSVVDATFVKQYTSGFAAFADDLRRESWDVIVRESGLDRGQIRQAAEIAMTSERTIVCWAMGLTQHRNAVANIQEAVNLLLIRGNIGRPGAGACPVRGHSNVQGDRTMGISHWMPDSFLDKLGAEFSFTPPREPGLDTVGAIRAMQQGKVEVLVALGGNLLLAAPDTQATAAALRRCRLTVQIATKLNRGHLITGEQALLLPCLGRTERDEQQSGPQFVTVENSMSVVSTSQGRLPPASPQLRSEVAIIAGMARAVLGVDWSAMVADYDQIRERIEQVVPAFDDFNRRVRREGGFLLPNAARERVFKTSDGKAQFAVHPIQPLALAADELLMMTIRSHDQFNTTVYGNDDRYRGVFGGRRVVFVNEQDAAERGWQQGQPVDLESTHGGQRRRVEDFVVMPYPIPRGCCATYFPEANALVPLESVAERSNTPTYKSVPVRLLARQASQTVEQTAGETVAR